MGLPKQTIFIVGNEACERFSFYGMRSILALYMINELMMSETESVEVMHLFISLIYILPLLGAWIADRFLGRYRTILYISLFYCLGHGVLALADLTTSLDMRENLLFLGLFIIALGAGGIKPCVSAFVGDQVDGQPSQVMTRVYAAFYWAINLGSFFSFLVVPYIRQTWGYSWAFAIPGVFMAIATLIFWCGRKYYRHKEPTHAHFFSTLLCRVFRGAREACARYGGEQVAKATNTTIRIAAFIVIAPIVVLLAVQCQDAGSTLASLMGCGEVISSLCGLLTLLLYVAAVVLAALHLAATHGVQNFFGTAGSMLYLGKEKTAANYSEEQIADTRGLMRVLIVFTLIIPFWSLYEQTMSSWVLQGKEMQPIQLWAGFRFGAEEMQSINPLLVMIFVPLLTLAVYPYIGRWSTPLRRMGMGIVLAGISYGAVAWLQARLDGGEQLSILWQSLPYFLLTISEILVSTTGLEYAYTAAGKNMKSTVLSFWYISSTLGNALVIYMTSLVDDPAATSTFLLYGGMCVVIGIIFMLITRRFRTA